MIEIAALGLVFAVGSAELWAALPLGFYLGLHPALAYAAAVAGAVTGVLTVIAGGTALRSVIVRHIFRGTDNRRLARIRRIVDRFGPPAFGFLVPLLVGPTASAAAGVLLGAHKRRLALWILAGIAFWGTVFASVLTLGFMYAGARIY